VWVPLWVLTVPLATSINATELGHGLRNKPRHNRNRMCVRTWLWRRRSWLGNDTRSKNKKKKKKENSGEVQNILKCFREVDIKKESKEKDRERERVWSACHGLVLLPNKKLLASLVAGDLISPALCQLQCLSLNPNPLLVSIGDQHRQKRNHLLEFLFEWVF
jgi:hypothetical protein